MALKGLKKTKDKRIEAKKTDMEKLDRGVALSSIPKKEANTFKITASPIRVTFSLHPEIHEAINQLVLKVRTKRISRSDVVKLGITALEGMTEKQLEDLVSLVILKD